MHAHDLIMNSLNNYTCLGVKMATQSATLSTAVSEPFRALNKPHQPRSFNYPTRTFRNKNPVK